MGEKKHTNKIPPKIQGQSRENFVCVFFSLCVFFRSLGEGGVRGARKAVGLFLLKVPGRGVSQDPRKGAANLGGG